MSCDQRQRYIQKFVDDDKTACAMTYRRIPWMKNSVENVLVFPINLESKYYDESNFLEVYDDKCDQLSDDKYYYVKSPYYTMRCYATKTTMDENTNIITVSYNNEMLSFKIGYKIRGIAKPVVQNFNMFQDEQKYINQITSTGLNINQLKTNNVSNDLRYLARISLYDFTPDQEYANIIIQHIEDNSNNAYDFAYKISKLIVAAKFGNTFSKRLYKGYYNEDTVHLLNDANLYEGIDFDQNQLDEYIEDAATNMLIYADQSNYIPTRKYNRNRTEKRIPKITKLDIRLRCNNIDNVKNVPDENLAFYRVNDKFYCYDIARLYLEFMNGNIINPDTGTPFSDDFINKIKTLYKFKINNIDVVQKDDDDEDYDAIVNQLCEIKLSDDEDYLKILEKVRLEIENLNVNHEKCFKCQKNVGQLGISTVNNKGELIKCCSKKCFEAIN